MKVCEICDRQLGFFTFKTAISDGYVCNECLKKYGLWNLSRPVSYNSSSIKKLIDKRKEWVTSFAATKVVGSYLQIDEKHDIFKIGNAMFKYSNLLSFELLEDGKTVTKGGLGRAVAGGVLFGGAGAIVGGVTGHKKSNNICTSLRIKVTLRNAHCDNIYISFINCETKKSGFLYQTCYNNAQICLSELEIISDKNKYAMQQVDVQTAEISPADEILKYKKLYDEGIITQEEFDAKKKQLLNL